MMTLSHAFESSGLITNAEYDNNKPSIFSGSLTLYLDSVEAVLSHNESDIKTWAPNEYELNLTYAYDKVAFSEYLMKLRDEIKQDTIKKIESENHRK